MNRSILFLLYWHAGITYGTSTTTTTVPKRNPHTLNGTKLSREKQQTLVDAAGSRLRGGRSSNHTKSLTRGGSALRAERQLVGRHCGCGSCDNDVWDTLAGQYTCGQRIEWLMTDQRKSEEEACYQVAANEYPTECGACNPTACHDDDDDDPICGCPDCFTEWWNNDANKYSCGERIEWLQTSQGYAELDACFQVGFEEFPKECRGCDPTSCGATAAPTTAPTVEPTNGPTMAPSKSTLPQCGGAVNVNSPTDSSSSCQDGLWGPTGDDSMPCFAYGGSRDPCHLSNTNDANDGLSKDPSLCTGDTFYLWDEPDTQGKDYAWAGETWAVYAATFATKIAQMKQNNGNTKVTTPLIRAGNAGVIMGNVNTFFQACGPPCQDPNSPAYIDVIAVNAFCGPWNTAPMYCRSGAEFILQEVENLYPIYQRPVYITNWSRLDVSNPEEQINAMDAIDAFFTSTSPIERVYWFGATDYGSPYTNSYNFLTNVLSDGITTLGDVWRTKCDSLFQV